VFGFDDGPQVGSERHLVRLIASESYNPQFAIDAYPMLSIDARLEGCA
jgi:hypothetical protein